MFNLFANIIFFVQNYTMFAIFCKYLNFLHSFSVFEMNCRTLCVRLEGEKREITCYNNSTTSWLRKVKLKCTIFIDFCGIAKIFRKAIFILSKMKATNYYFLFNK